MLWPMTISANWPSRARMVGRDSTCALPAVAMAWKVALKLLIHHLINTAIPCRSRQGLGQTKVLAQAFRLCAQAKYGLVAGDVVLVVPFWVVVLIWLYTIGNKAGDLPERTVAHRCNCLDTPMSDALLSLTSRKTTRMSTCGCGRVELGEDLLYLLRGHLVRNRP